MGKIDWDDVFSYDTFKTVKVRDRRLGLLHYFFLVSIFAYIVYTVWSQQLFLRTEPVTGGSIRTTILPGALSAAAPAYCKAAPAGCMYLSSSQVTPAAEEGTIFITSRVSVTMATNVSDTCNPYVPTSPSCQPSFPKSQAQTYFTANIESYTLMSEHTVRGFSTDVSFRNGVLTGYMRDNAGKVIRAFVPFGTKDADVASIASQSGIDKANVVVRGSTVPGDILTVQDILLAANITSLDNQSTSPSANPGDSMRSSGIVLIGIVTVFPFNGLKHTLNRLSWTGMIDYHNSVTDPNTFTYTYRFYAIDGAEAKTLENRYIPTGPVSSTASLQEWNRHGIRIKFVQTGKVGSFQLIALLTNLVASVALFRMATLVVEILMLYVLPEKAVYQHYKYTVTEDLNPDDSMNPLKRLLHRGGRSTGATPASSIRAPSPASGDRLADANAREAGSALGGAPGTAAATTGVTRSPPIYNHETPTASSADLLGGPARVSTARLSGLELAERGAAQPHH
ncbi:hypothetical protein BC828DRAFT_198883 [Blastocladiella britannica]|nr:hypothetical protein BC828DRAFT_198883 [Blastocladiella britannica]